MKQQLGLSFIVCISLSACGLLVAPQGKLCSQENGTLVYCGNIKTVVATHKATEYTEQYHALDSQLNHKQLSDYIEQMALALSDQIHYPIQAPIAVASFVQLNSTLKNTNILGNQIAESFLNELQEFGLPVIDFKTTGMIQVTPRGDFVFSRHYEELTEKQEIGYVLSGTLIENKEGIIVNARIINAQNKQLLSTTKIIIPHFILNKIQS